MYENKLKRKKKTVRLIKMYFKNKREEKVGKKRLFLLAMMAVIMSTVGYSDTFKANQEEQYTKEDITVSSGNGHQLNAGKENEETKVTNEFKITVENGTGVNLYNSGSNKGKNIFTNNGIIEVKGGKGIQISNNGTAINDGMIIVKNGTGVLVQKDSTANFNNRNIMEISGSTSIGIQLKEGSKSRNDGMINVTNGGIGVNIKDKISDFYNNENGTINVSGIELKYDKNGNITGGTASVGIKIEDGEVNDKDGEGVVNKGTINVIGGDTLIKYGTDNKVVGEVSGVLLNTKKANFKNDGIIYVIGTKTGGPSGYQAKGININSKDATATNTGIIIAEKDGIGVLSKGTFTNEEDGIIYAQNKGIGIQTANTGTATNTGKIAVSNKGVGIKITKDTNAINEKEIITDGTGAGVQLTNGVFINSGEINAGNGNAIVSLDGNNTVYLKDGSKITGQILGEKGVDVLTLGTGSYSGLNVNKYEAVTTRGGGDISVSNSTIALEYNKGTNGYLTTSKDKLDKADKKETEKGNLSLSNSILIIDIKNQNVDGENNSLGTMIDADKISFDNVKFGFNSLNGEKEFNISDILNDATDGNMDSDALDYLGSSSTAIWTYSKDKDGDWIANKKLSVRHQNLK